MQSSRRDFLRASPTADRAAHSAAAATTVEIVSIIVNAWPQHLETVAADILALGGAEIHGRDPKGKLIVVLEDVSQGGIGAKVNVISGLPNVLSAVMVFQATDTNEAQV